MDLIKVLEREYKGDWHLCFLELVLLHESINMNETSKKQEATLEVIQIGEALIEVWEKIRPDY